MKSRLFLALLLIAPSLFGSLNDKETTILQMKEILAAFNKAREWDAINTPKDLSMALAIEASELMEVFLRMTDLESRDAMFIKEAKIKEEAADVLIYLLCFCNAVGLDISAAVEEKIAINAKKYPAAKCKGKRLKYTEL
ncbi:nucleotide pyrophosphohydrolase [Candidatus Babeliales bacterium]|nr:nucleotide pyrophosphohydrolase [Candidatus Babeliales bacterium]